MPWEFVGKCHWKSCEHNEEESVSLYFQHIKNQNPRLVSSFVLYLLLGPSYFVKLLITAPKVQYLR
jgi:hypothetical protein